MLDKVMDFIFGKKSDEIRFKESIIIGILPILFISLIKVLVILVNFFLPDLIKPDLELNIFINISFGIAFISVGIIIEKYKDFKDRTYLFFSSFFLFLTILISIFLSASLYYDDKDIQISKPNPRMDIDDMKFIIRNIEKYCNKN